MRRNISIGIRRSGTVALAGLLLDAAACGDDHGSTPTPLPPKPPPTSPAPVATVSTGGVVRALAEGRTTISATSETVRGKMTLEVETPASLPVLTSISPAAVTAWSSNFTMTFTGKRFSPAAWVRIGGAIIIPEYVSETELRVRVRSTHLLLMVRSAPAQ